MKPRKKFKITSSSGICNIAYYNGSYLLLFGIYCYCYLPDRLFDLCLMKNVQKVGAQQL